MIWLRENRLLIAGLALPVVALAVFLVVTRLPAALTDPPSQAAVVVVRNIPAEGFPGLRGHIEVRDGALYAVADSFDSAANPLTRPRIPGSVDRVFVTTPDPGLRELYIDWPKQPPAAPQWLPVAGIGPIDTREVAADGYRFDDRRGGDVPILSLIYDGSGNGFTLRRGMVMYHLRLPPPLRYYPVEFLGWVQG